MLLSTMDRSLSEKPCLVIFRIGSVGDTVVSLPCFHAIARKFPGHRRILLTNAVDSVRASSAESIINGTGLVHETLYFPVGRGKLRYSVALASKLRRLNADALIHLTPRTTALQVYRDLIFFRTAGIRKIIGAPLRAGLRDCQVDPVSGELEYEAERLTRQLRPAVEVSLQQSDWDLRFTAAEQATARQKLLGLAGLRPLVALAPGARIPAKDWGAGCWEALIRLLQTRMPDISLVFVGAPDERKLAESLCQLWPGAMLNLCGDLTPRESAAVLSRCDLLICHDSGPMHLAASQGTRCIALFGNFNRPRQWFPYGAGHVVIHEPKGVRNIGVEQVADAIEATLWPMRQTTPAVPALRSHYR
jgi:heptosyltransferase III